MTKMVILLQVERAVKDGYDVRGFMYWTLIDNFEYVLLEISAAR
jgi:beta-glucosidase/6-phospho-beta-glucosidase/beta-galactosidase